MIRRGDEMTLREAIEQNDVVSLDDLLLEEPNRIEGDADGVWYPFYPARLGCFDCVKYIVEYSRASFHVKDENQRGILHVS